MPGYLLTMNSVLMCTHSGKVQFVAPNPRVRVMGTPVPMGAPVVTVAMTPCTFVTPAGVPLPSVSGFLLSGHTTRVKSMGMPMLCETSRGMAVPCGGSISVTTAAQMKVKAL